MNAIKYTASALLFAALAWPAFGAGKSATEVRKQIEMSMVLTGRVTIADDGQVRSLQIDRENEVPALVGQVVRGSVSKWRFDPLKPGETDAGTTSMRVRVVASPAPEEGPDKFALRIVSASFGETPEDEMPKRASFKPPVFPMAAAYARAPATVYLVARIGRNGKVEEVFAEQVNLKAVGNERQMKQFRELFADASVTAAKRWTFTAPARGPEVDDDHWSVRVPVDFVFERQDARYGHWEAYVPGPRQKASWQASERDATAGVDAVSGDKMQMVGRGPRLLTPLPQG
ncbi:energy transducer TonB [Lysobacter sp. CA199]|uniref:energy transducer TonB n=1 Tax=Lysobacter sp. CA199 TaxID=3455608 RepID=UPI003F8CFB3C